MGLTGRDNSCNFVKVASSSSVEYKKNKKNYSDTRDDKLCTLNSSGNQNASIRLRIHDMGPLCKARKKAAQFFPNSGKDDDEDVDFAKQFGKVGWPDDDKCMWLSSGSMSPSCFDDYRFSRFLDLSLDERLVSLQPILANCGVFLGSAVSFYDGSRVNPIEEASLLLESTSFDEDRNLQEDLNEEEVVTWLVSWIGNDLTDSSVTCSASAESSCGQSLETFSSCDDSLSSFNTNFDSPSGIWNSDRTDFWVSLVNLDEDVEWISDRESKLDYFQSDLPSASLKSSLGSEVQFSNYINPSVTEVHHEKSQSIASSEGAVNSVNSEDVDTNEPLFWPLDGESDWGSEVAHDFLIMSPRKNKHNVETPERTSSKSFRLKLHNRKLNSEQGCRRRLVVGSGSTSSKLREFKSTNSDEGCRRLNAMPSRLSKSTINSMKLVPLDMEEDITEPTDENVLIEKSASKFRSFLEDDFSSNEELPIEKLLGLDEFDGHEGLESEFNKDDFSLSGSL